MVYLISKIRSTNHEINYEIAGLATSIENEPVFIPHEYGLENFFINDHEHIETKAFELDINKIKESSKCYVALPIGSDCSAEIGYCSGINKEMVLPIVNNSQFTSYEMYNSIKNDWMVKGFVDTVLCSPEIYEIVKSDSILKNKNIRIVHGNHWNYWNS